MILRCFPIRDHLTNHHSEDPQPVTTNKKYLTKIKTMIFRARDRVGGTYQRNTTLRKSMATQEITKVGIWQMPCLHTASLNFKI